MILTHLHTGMTFRVLLTTLAALIALAGAPFASAQTRVLRSASGQYFRAGQPVPSGAWQGQSSGATNYLEPYDPTLLPGQIRLDGLLGDTLDSTTTSFHMRVLWVTLPGQRRAVLGSVRVKEITIDRTTQFTVLRSRSAVPTLSQITAPPFHVMAVGIDSGPGRPLLALRIDIEPATPLETSLADSMQRSDGQRADPPGPGIRLEEVQVDSGDGTRSVQVVRADPGTFRIAVGLAHGRVGATESLAGIAQSYGAIAAINGSFFEAYASGPVKMPDHALITDGRLVSRGGVGTILGQTPEGQIRMDKAVNAIRWHEYDPLRPARQQDPAGSVLFWARVVEAVGCGPRLVTDGAVSLSPYSEGFGSSEMLSGVSVRSAVGITRDGGLILIVTHASLPELARIMLELGCRDAMNLDGGASSGLWIRGQSVRTPGRQISNALLLLPR